MSVLNGIGSISGLVKDRKIKVYPERFRASVCLRMAKERVFYREQNLDFTSYFLPSVSRELPDPFSLCLWYVSSNVLSS